MSPAILLLIGLALVFYFTRNRNNFSPEAAQAQEMALKNVMSYYKPHIQASSIMYGVPQNLIAAIIFQESGGNADAQGSSGEIGLMQVTPAALDDMNRKYNFRYTSKDLFFANRNIQVGTAYFAYLRQQCAGDISTALRAYNAGLGHVTSANDIGRDYANSVLSFSSLLT